MMTLTFDELQDFFSAPDGLDDLCSKYSPQALTDALAVWWFNLRKDANLIPESELREVEGIPTYFLPKVVNGVELTVDTPRTPTDSTEIRVLFNSNEEAQLFQKNVFFPYEADRADEYYFATVKPVVWVQQYEEGYDSFVGLPAYEQLASQFGQPLEDVLFIVQPCLGEFEEDEDGSPVWREPEAGVYVELSSYPDEYFGGWQVRASNLSPNPFNALDENGLLRVGFLPHNGIHETYQIVSLPD